MKMRLVAVVLLSLGLASSCAYGKKLFGPSPDPLQRLEDAHHRLVVGAGSVKPSTAAEMGELAAEMQAMIDATKAGQELDVAKADKLIRRSYQPMY